MKTVTVNLDKNMIEILDNIIQLEIFPNRSECIRTAIRNLLLFHQKIKVEPFDKRKIILTELFKKEIFHFIENKTILDNQLS